MRSVHCELRQRGGGEFPAIRSEALTFDGIAPNKRLLIDPVSGAVQCVQYSSGTKPPPSCDCNLHRFCSVLAIRVLSDLLAGWSSAHHFTCRIPSQSPSCCRWGSSTTSIIHPFCIFRRAEASWTRCLTLGITKAISPRTRWFVLAMVKCSLLVRNGDKAHDCIEIYHWVVVSVALWGGWSRLR
uniref:Uncharacterized protein n=1 Tax=Physcomitrium patens TaxID=3218 RepID=A0A2K1IW14_PHYPA|nr:hypothetical protein PHYPA_025411 [Physcomitrium patens]